MTDATVTFDLFNALKVPFDARRTKVWVTFNTDDGWIVDENGDVRMDAGTATITDAGHVTIAGIPVPGVDTNPTDFQVKVHFDAPFVLPGVRGLQRKTGDFGWMTVTADADLSDLIAEQYVPPTWISEAIATLEAIIADATTAFDDTLDQGQALLDAQIALSGIGTSDSAVAGLISNPLLGVLTGPALAGSVDAEVNTTGRAANTGLIATIVGWVTTVGSSVHRALAKMFARVYTPEAYGAVGDGTTDDTAAIIAADTAAQTNGGGTVMFDSNKTYRVDGRLARTFAGTTGTPTSKPVRWTSSGPSSASGQWVTNPLNGGATLDLRYPGRVDTATVTSGSATVLDTTIATGDAGLRVTGTGVPVDTFIGTVVAGVSFKMSSSSTSQVDVLAVSNGTSVTVGLPKIDTRGCGRLEIDHINLISGGTDNNKFLQTTNTTVHIHHCFIRGNAANSQTTCQQDVFFLGGTDGTLGDHANAPFQGYGSRIHDNHFDRIRRGVVGRTYCNSVPVENNTFSTKCGNDGATGTATLGGAVEFIGTSGTGICVGNAVVGNTIEVPYYKYAVAASYANANTFGPNGIWDAQAGGGTTHVAGYYLEPLTATYNTVLDGQHNSAYPLVRDKGMTNTVRTSAQARGSFYPQNGFYRGKVAYVSNGSNGAGPSIMSRQGDYAFMRCSAGSATNPSYPSVYLGTSTATLVADLATTSGSNIVTSATAAFVAEQLWMPLAATGIPNNTLIVRWISATQVELSADATATATGVTAQIGKAPGVGTNTDLIEFTRGGHIVIKGAIGAAATPPAALGTAGNGAAVSAVGKDPGFVLTVTTASTGTSIGTMATVAWGVAYTSSAGVPSLTPMNQAAAEAMATNRIWAAPTNSNFVLMSGVGTLPVSTTMIFGVHMMQS